MGSGCRHICGETEAAAMGSKSFRADANTGGAAMGSDCCHICGATGAAATMGPNSHLAGVNTGGGAAALGSKSAHTRGDAAPVAQALA